MNETDSGTCQMVGFCLSSVELLGFATIVFVI
jgi:hypothetical protein